MKRSIGRDLGSIGEWEQKGTHENIWMSITEEKERKKEVQGGAGKRASNC